MRTDTRGKGDNMFISLKGLAVTMAIVAALLF
jgi:hypothetical protein